MSAGVESRTIRELVDRMSERQPESVFLLSPESGREVTFRALQERLRLLCAEFVGAGLAPGDKIAFLLDNGLFTAQLFLGAMYGGFVVVPLNVRAGVTQLAYTLDHCDAEVVYVSQDYAALIQEVLAEGERAVRVISAEMDAELASTRTAAPRLELLAPGPEDPALLMYTSGSTGQPKAAVHSHRTVLAGARNSIAAHQLTSSDRSLLLLPLYHINAECVTLIPTLLSGGSVVVPHRFSVSQFWDWLEEYHCTWSALVPTIISQLLDWKDPRAATRRDALKAVRFLRSSSAPLAPSLHQEFLDKFQLLLIQAMGSSEAGNIFSNPLPPGANKIGSPGLPWGFDVRIVNREGIELPTGESGEMEIRGAALMQGYYKQPDETGEVLDAEGWMHTGDLAYRDEDGYFFVVGRSKELIIKGGVNIAPRQIDDVLESHPAVLEAAAVGIPDHYLGEDLVAFVVLRAGAAPDESELLSYCEQRLGQFKTPTRIYFTSDLPKGPSGKVQRLRLREDASPTGLSAVSQANGPAPHDGWQVSDSSIEQLIAESWAAVLSATRIEADSNFFALGGHSLLAVECVSRLRETIPVALSLSDFFENTTVAQQAALVRRRLLNENPTTGPGASVSSAPPRERALQNVSSSITPSVIPPRDRSLPCPLSPGQRRLWFMEQLHPGLPVYNESEAVRLAGDLNVEALERAVNVIVARHEILRTTIDVIDGEPVATVHQTWQIQIKKIDLGALTGSVRQAEVERLLVDEPRRLYDFRTEPGIRVTLLGLGPHEHVLILMMHHIVCDWSSEGVMWRELSVLYRAVSHNEPPSLPPLPIQFGDYADWQVKQHVDEDFEEDLAFWEQNLRGAPQLLDLPADRTRPPALSYRGARKRIALDPALAGAVRDIGQRAGVTPFTVFAAALNTLLYRYTGNEDILIGIPVANRDRKDLQLLIGFLLYVQVLRSELTGDMTFRELLASVQKGALGLYLHRAAPFDQVVRRLQPERNLSYSPLFQVMLIWRDRDQLLPFIGLEGLTVESLLSESGTSKFDLTLFVTDCGDQVWLDMEYSTDLFDDERMERMLAHYKTLLESVAHNPDLRLAEVPLLTPRERDQLLGEWNQTQTIYPEDRLLDQMFEAQAERTPDAVAVVFEDRQLTYRQLNDRADRLARYLRTCGVGPGALVGIFVERSLEMPVGLLGILKSTGAYVPLDPAYPAGRLAFMIDDCQPRVLVTLRSLQERLPPNNARVVCLDTPFDQSDDGEPHGAVRQSSDLAYVLYTSGSTGKPNGVEIPHRALVNFLSSMQREPGLRSDDVLLAVTTPSFDIAALEIFLPLITGARVVIAGKETIADGARLSSLMKRCAATVMQATPSTWRLLLDAGWKGSRNLKILCGGEPWPESLAHDLLERCKSLWNMYGPTETTVWSSVARVGAGGPVLIGSPIANTTFYVLDTNRKLVPIGVPGELYIGGDGLARGYLGRPDLTKSRFVADPFHADRAARLYKTGDLVRRLADGSIEFIHRIDQQVKLRGFRIELGEIEATLKQHPLVGQCAALVREDSPGNRRLVAYISPIRPGSVPKPRELRDYLKQKLPVFMIPATCVVMQKLPLTPNGKLDRKQLPLPESLSSGSDTTGRIASPLTTLELSLISLWKQVLDVETIEVRDNFFDLGGHSLQAVQLFVRIEKMLGVKLPLATLYQAPTIELLAQVISEGSSPSGWSPLVPIQPQGSRSPFFCFHAAGGNILNYRKLSQYMGSKQPFYGLQSQGLDGCSPLLTTIEEMAALYVRAIQSVQPRGPYFLGGYCLGGTIAYEVAQQLRAAGESIALLALFDTLNWHFVSPRIWTRIGRTLQRIAFHGMGLTHLDSKGKVKFIKGKFEVLRDRLPVWGGLLLKGFDRRRSRRAAPSLSLLGRVWETNHRAAHKYIAKPYPGVVTDFRPSSQYWVLDKPELKWGQLAKGGVRVVTLPVFPGAMLVDPLVQHLAELLTNSIDETLFKAEWQAEEVTHQG
jgi:amino acid adenylation domain-containing protein